MHPALTAAACCVLTAAPPPLAQSWSDTALIATDDDWSGVPAIVGYRGDGMVAEPGVDPSTVLADGSTTPIDVTANRTDPGTVGLPAGVAEFELTDPVVALEGSATAAAPHLVIALDTRGRTAIAVRLVLRDIDASSADAVEPVAVQYRVGGAGAFENAPGGYVADATTGPGEARAVTELRTVLPAAADDRQLVEVRVMTTNADGRDEWVGVDDIEVSAAAVAGPGDCDPPPPPPLPGPPSQPDPEPAPQPSPRAPSPELSALSLSPDTFRAARRGPAIVRSGRAGAALRFRLSRPALVRFRVVRLGDSVLLDAQAAPDRNRLQVRGRRGLNRMRFTGRIRGRALGEGTYVLTAVATDSGRRASAPSAARFRILGRADQSSRMSAPGWGQRPAD